MKKILIISHNPINTTDNMGKTIGNIFSKFQKEKLCQLYFRKQNVEAKNCENFFCIDDISMLKSILNRKYETGSIVKNNTNIDEFKETTEEIFQYGRKRTGLIYIARNILWKIGKWNTKALKSWLKKMNPMCIFFVAGDYSFAFKISMKIAKKLNIPLYIYFTDEFYRDDIGKTDIFKSLYKIFYRKNLKNAIEQSKTYFTITNEMLDFYEKEFNKVGKVLMNTTEINEFPEISYQDIKNIQIKYIGNLGYDRWKNIIEINDIINKVNNKGKIKFSFEVYSGEKQPYILEQIKDKLKDNFKGTITKEETEEKIKEANILIHTESFEKKNREQVKYSLSTKIPDILASRRILLAYGPEEIASIKYVRDNEIGLVANNKEDLEKLLIEISENKINYSEMFENAAKIVEKNHRIDVVYNVLNNAIVRPNQKKNILQINTVCGVGSTGRIAVDLKEEIDKNKYNMYIAYGYGKSNIENTIKIGTKLDYIIHNILSRITGKQGGFSYFATQRFLKKVNKIKPDIIHLHNIHGNYVNYKLLFRYIQRHNIPVIWTLHDAWAFTGKCVHFDYINCKQWIEGCQKCKNLKDYPTSLIDSSKKEYIRKKKIFTNTQKLTVVTPSEWLANLVKKSYLKKYDIVTINNGIDLEIFKTINVKKENKKFTILGVANDWNKKKGIEIFASLANTLPDKYKIIMIGLSKKQMQELPNNIVKIEKTNSKEELAKYYNMADVFINPTLEDNFPTTNIEALACGTPVITFKTGGSPEIISENTGIVVKKGDLEQLTQAIEKVYNKNFGKEDCVKRAKRFSRNAMLKKYINLYERILEENR